MIHKIKVAGFRSIKEQIVELSPLTVLYGATASGKSSLLYSLLVLKNFLANPNQLSDGFFSLGFMDLGGFDECIFNHESDRSMEISFITQEGTYGIILEKNKGEVYLRQKIISPMRAKINIPYALNQNFTFVWEDAQREKYTIHWNGITCQVVPTQTTTNTQQRAMELSTQLNRIPETLKKIDIVPHKRGFFKPFYASTPTSPLPNTEEEVASIVINDPNLAPRISVDLEDIMDRDFRLYTPPGTSIVYFQTTDKKSRVPNYLVNDGYGVNQIVYMLAKIHRPNIKTILIEEPEVHLHPSKVRALAKILCNIVKNEEKQIILVTHSEVLVSSLLSLVAKKEITPEKIRFFLALKENKETKFELQKIQENGQIEGGLSSFIEGELEELKIMLGLIE